LGRRATGKERKGKERKGKERKGKERKGKERYKSCGGKVIYPTVQEPDTKSAQLTPIRQRS
jgi:hypothetical protein